MPAHEALESQTKDCHRAVVKAGAITASLSCGALIAIAVIIEVSCTPLTAGYLPLIFVFAIPWVVVSAIVGSVIGKFVSNHRSSRLAAAKGIVIALSIAGLYHLLFVSSIEPPDARVGPYLFAFIIGSSSAIGAIAAMRSFPNSIRLDFHTAALLTIPLLTVVAGFAYQIHSNKLATIINRAGGSVSWNALADPRGRWVIEFRGSQLSDSDLQSLIPTLESYPRLDLDLGGTAVTDSGVAQLTSLPNLTRLRVDHTVVTDSQVAALRRTMPNVQFHQTWP